MDYIIQSARKTPNGYITDHLATDNKWYSASNIALRFKSPKEASEYYKSNKIDRRGIEWINGPRGGTYSVDTGK